MGLAEGAQSLLDQGRVGQHPAVQSAVINLQAALPKQLFDVTIAERVAQVPRDRLQDQRRLEVPALEVVLRPALQLLDKGVQEHGPPPVRRHLCGPQAQRGVNAKTLRQPRLMTAGSFGKMPTTSARRLISRLSRSSGFVEAICAQCSRGKAMYMSTSSCEACISSASLGKRSRSVSATCRH